MMIIFKINELYCKTAGFYIGKCYVIPINSYNIHTFDISECIGYVYRQIGSMGNE